MSKEVELFRTIQKSLADKTIRPHLILFLAASAGSVVYGAFRISRAADYLEVMQIVCTLILILHWVWGGTFYFFYFRNPRGPAFYLLDAMVAAFLFIALIMFRLIFLWFLLLALSYFTAVLMYRLQPNSPHFDERVRSFANRKSALDLAVLLLLFLGMVFDILNRAFLSLSLWKPLCLLTSFVMTVGSHLWILISRFYNLDKYRERRSTLLP